MIVRRRFKGVIDGQVKEFRPGDTITEDEAKELGLSGKSHLAKKESKRAQSAKA